MFKLKIKNNLKLIKELYSLRQNPKGISTLFSDVIDEKVYCFETMFLSMDGLNLVYESTRDKKHTLINFEALSYKFPDTEMFCEFRLWDKQISDTHLLYFSFSPGKGWSRNHDNSENEEQNSGFYGEWSGFVNSDPIFSLFSLIDSELIQCGSIPSLSYDSKLLNKFRESSVYKEIIESIPPLSEEAIDYYSEVFELEENPFYKKTELLYGVIFPKSKETIISLGEDVFLNKWLINYIFSNKDSKETGITLLYDFYLENYEKLNNPLLDEQILIQALNDENDCLRLSLPVRFERYYVLKVFNE